jgi:hypothetical protein
MEGLSDCKSQKQRAAERFSTMRYNAWYGFSQQKLERIAAIVDEM